MHIQDVGQLFDLIARAVVDVNANAGFQASDKVFHLSTGYVISGAGNEDCNGEASYRKIGFEERGNYQDINIETDADGLKLVGGDDPLWSITTAAGLAYIANNSESEADPTLAEWELDVEGVEPLPTLEPVIRVYPSTITQLTEKLFADPTFTGITTIPALALADLAGALGITAAAGHSPLLKMTDPVNAINNYGGFKVAGNHLIFEAVIGSVAKTLDLGALS